MCHATIFRNFFPRYECILAISETFKRSEVRKCKRLFWSFEKKIINFLQRKKMNPHYYSYDQPSMNKNSQRYKPYRLLINLVVVQTLLAVELMNQSHAWLMDPNQMRSLCYDQRAVNFSAQQRQRRRRLVVYRMQDSIQYSNSCRLKINQHQPKPHEIKRIFTNQK